MSTAILDDLREFIAYFEEPEPGVPEGFSGWYHSRGRFPLRSSRDAFKVEGDSRHGPLNKEVTGPFMTREQAMSDLTDCLEA